LPDVERSRAELGVAGALDILIGLKRADPLVADDRHEFTLGPGQQARLQPLISRAFAVEPRERKAGPFDNARPRRHDGTLLQKHPKLVSEVASSECGSRASSI